MTESLPPPLPKFVGQRHISSNLLAPAPSRGRDLRGDNQCTARPSSPLPAVPSPSLVVGLTGPAAQARTVDANESSVRSRPRPACPAPAASSASPSDRHVVSYGIKNGRVNGFQDQRPHPRLRRDGGRLLRHARTPAGRAMLRTERRGSATGSRASCPSRTRRTATRSNLGTKRVRPDSGFAPRLFADGYSASTPTRSTTAGALQRCTLTKYATATSDSPSGSSSATGYGSLTSLQAEQPLQEGPQERKRVPLRDRRPRGALKQIAVPFKKADPRDA